MDVKFYRGRKFSLTIHGAKPENCPILKLLKQQFQQEMYTVAAVAYETGQNGIHPHWQIYFQLAESVNNMKIKISSLLEPLGLQQSFHIEKAKGTLRANLAYVYAVRKQHELGWVQYAKGHIEPYDYDKKKEDLNDLLWLHHNMKPWQVEIVNKLFKRPSRREIMWIYDPQGGLGKSYLTKYLHYFHGAIVTGGKPSDMKHAVSRWKEITGQYPVMILFDVARSADITKNSYYAIQQMKNGMFFSGKYQSGMVATLSAPHIVIFANDLPDRKYFTFDRWWVRTIDPKTQSLVECQ